jgi:hypothetical protein
MAQDMELSMAIQWQFFGNAKNKVASHVNS